MTQEVLEKRRKSLLEDYDYEQKIRLLSLKKRIDWFVTSKPFMSQCEKWEAFDDMQEDYDVNRERLIEMINREIRKRGLSVWDA
jgi:hypothetical protein